jgi:hypothetical protein
MSVAIVVLGFVVSPIEVSFLTSPYLGSSLFVLRGSVNSAHDD